MTILSTNPFEAFDQLKKARELAPDQPGMDNALWLTLKRTIAALTEARKREIKVQWDDITAFIGQHAIGRIISSIDYPGKWYATSIYSELGIFRTEPEARAAVEAAAIAALTEREAG